MYNCDDRKHNSIDAARKAAIRIQANWRSKLARKEFLKSKTSAVLIQSGFRGARARGQLAMQVRYCLLSEETRTVCMYVRMYVFAARGSVDASVCMAAAQS